MPKKLSKEQKLWLKVIASDSAKFEQDAERQEERADKLQELQRELDLIRGDLQKAQEFQVKWTKEQKETFWRKEGKVVTKTMNWSEANPGQNEDGTVKASKGKDKKDRMFRDIEVDTKHDLKVKRGKDNKVKVAIEINEESVVAVQKMHEKLVMLQARMEDAKDAQGNPLFTARDIERELWSPLVKADIIPSNAVADRYSQEAQVFNGAIEIYEDMLKEHTKTASKHEKAQRMLRIGKDTLALVGTVASQAVRISEFNGTGMSGQEGRELKAQVDLSVTGEEDPELLAKRLSQFEDQLDNNLAQSGIALTMGVLNGVIDISGKALDKPDDKRNWAIAELVFQNVADAAVNSIGVVRENNMEKGVGVVSQDSKTATAAAQNLVRYGLAGSKVIFRLKEALDASDGDRSGFVKAMVLSIGDAVGSAFAAFDVASDRSASTDDIVDQGTAGQWAKVGAYVSGAIIASANVAEIVKELNDAKKEGRDPNIKGIVGALGLQAVASIMQGTYVVASDGTRKGYDNTAITLNPNEETEYEKGYRKQGDPDALREFSESMKDINGMMALLDGKLPSMEDLQQKAVAESDAKATKLAEAEMRALAEKMKNPKFRKKFEADLEEEATSERAAIMEKIAIASISPEELGDPEKASKAMAMMDELIAESEACKQKWALLDGLTAGGAAMIAKFAPGAGLVVALRQLVSDVVQLVQKSKELNLWRKNMALTYGNDSVYGPAISSRLSSAAIQVSQKTLNVIFSSVGVAAEGMRLADVMGAATATSIANTMARALSDYGYKMQKEAEIEIGWYYYKKARSPEGQGDRKLARKAVNWNSTLSKCVMAYGIVKDDDPIAAEMARNCGLTPEVLADQHDVCQKVVQYFMSVYSDDPVVLKRIPVKKPWHPGIPQLTLESWLSFKAAALVKAVPSLDRTSTQTREIDDALARMDGLWKGKGYGARRDGLARDAVTSGDFDPLDAYLEAAVQVTEALIKALDDFTPTNGPVPEGTGDKWTEGALHEGMSAIIDSLKAQTIMLRTEARYDLSERRAADD
jgi:hypothetical protein